MNGIIHMKANAYKKFLEFAMKHAHPKLPRSQWQEVLGVLVGRFTEDHIVIITDVIPLAVGSGYHVEVHDYTKIFSVLPPERMERGEFIVGWIHTHPGLGLFLSSTDVHTQSLYQKLDSRSVAIVCDPTKISPSYPGMKAFRIKTVNNLMTSSLQEIPLIITEMEEKDFTTIHQHIADQLLRKKMIPIITTLPPREATRRLYLSPDELLRTVVIHNWGEESTITLQWICPHPKKDLEINVKLTPNDSMPLSFPEKDINSQHSIDLGATPTDFATSVKEDFLTSFTEIHLKVQTPPPNEWPPRLLLPVIPLATWTLPNEMIKNLQIIITKGSCFTYPPLLVT